MIAGSGSNLALREVAAQFFKLGWGSESPSCGAYVELRRWIDANPVASICRLAGIAAFRAVLL